MKNNMLFVAFGQISYPLRLGLLQETQLDLLGVCKALEVLGSLFLNEYFRWTFSLVIWSFCLDCCAKPSRIMSVPNLQTLQSRCPHFDSRVPERFRDLCLPEIVCLFGIWLDRQPVLDVCFSLGIQCPVFHERQTTL